MTQEYYPVLKTYCKSAIISCISNFVYQKKFQVGGSFGVFFGGFFSDRIVTRLGLHSRLWVLSAFTMLSVPFAFLTLYTPVSPFPRSRNLTKFIFRKHSECSLKKNISAHYILDNVAHILLLC